MDAILFLVIGLYYLAIERQTFVDTDLHLETRLNPEFYRDNNAFMRLYLNLKGDGKL